MTKVSVIIPAYNAEGTLFRTLMTVTAQTYVPLEIIVIDDSSNDRTADIVREVALRDPRVLLIIQQSNAGVAAARNTGIEAATGEWIAPLDHDDIWHPRNLELQMKAARERGEDTGMVYAWSRRIDEQDRVIGDMGAPRIMGNVTHHLLASNFMRNASSTIFRRDLALAVGGFDPGLRRAGAQGAEDLKIYLEISKITEVALAPYFLTGYRLLQHSMSQNAERMRRSVEMVLQEQELAKQEFPAAVFDIARTNFDLYAGKLAFGSKEWLVFAKHVWRALWRRPLAAGIYLSLSALWKSAAALRDPDKRVNFADLAADDHIAVPLGDWFTRFEINTVERAMSRGSRQQGAVKSQA